MMPGTVMSKSGVQGLIVAPGVAGMKIVAEALKVWHKAAGPGDTPVPGDPYLLTDGGSNVKHVGIIRTLDVPDSVHGLVWETMDAGQGGGQAADFVRRKVERRAARAEFIRDRLNGR